MTDLAEQYRLLADRARADAEDAFLPNVRRLHLQSAERLEQLIRGLDSTADAKMRNDRAKLGMIEEA